MVVLAAEGTSSEIPTLVSPPSRRARDINQQLEVMIKLAIELKDSALAWLEFHPELLEIQSRRLIRPLQERFSLFSTSGD
jgi:hypothetical protein